MVKGKKVVAAAVAQFVLEAQTSSGQAIASVANSTDEGLCPRKRTGRYRRSGALPSPKHSFWRRIDGFGDDLEFLQFTALTRTSFDELVKLMSPGLLSRPIDVRFGRPQAHHLRRRMFSPRDIVAMIIKWMTSKRGSKNIHVQFGSILETYTNCCYLGLSVMVETLIVNPKAKVFWDTSEDGLKICTELTNCFKEIPNVVAMIDGDKLDTQENSDREKQNRDFNGWTHSNYRNLVMMWNPLGKIIDCCVNAPGTFHDSKITRWGNIYRHIEKLPAGFKVVCDDAFDTHGVLQDKIVKTKERYRENNVSTEYDSALTHMRQCSEWGNNVLTGVCLRLRDRLPIDNVARSQILWACILFHNYRTETVGRNQIKTYFLHIQSNN